MRVYGAALALALLFTVPASAESLSDGLDRIVVRSLARHHTIRGCSSAVERRACARDIAASVAITRVKRCKAGM